MKTQPTGKPRRQRTGPQKARPTVHLEFENAAARKVCVAGTFNNWEPGTEEMTLLGGGKWVKDLNLPPGTYEYRLVVDGNWIPDPNADHAVLNSFGERNSVLTVPADP